MAIIKQTAPTALLCLALAALPAAAVPPRNTPAYWAWAFRVDAVGAAFHLQDHDIQEYRHTMSALLGATRDLSPRKAIRNLTNLRDWFRAHPYAETDGMEPLLLAYWELVRDKGSPGQIAEITAILDDLSQEFRFSQLRPEYLIPVGSHRSPILINAPAPLVRDMFNALMTQLRAGARPRLAALLTDHDPCRPGAIPAERLRDPITQQRLRELGYDVDQPGCFQLGEGAPGARLSGAMSACISRRPSSLMFAEGYSFFNYHADIIKCRSPQKPIPPPLDEAAKEALRREAEQIRKDADTYQAQNVERLASLDREYKSAMKVVDQLSRKYKGVLARARTSSDLPALTESRDRLRRAESKAGKISDQRRDIIDRGFDMRSKASEIMDRVTTSPASIARDARYAREACARVRRYGLEDGAITALQLDNAGSGVPPGLEGMSWCGKDPITARSPSGCEQAMSFPPPSCPRGGPQCGCKAPKPLRPPAPRSTPSDCPDGEASIPAGLGFRCGLLAPGALPPVPAWTADFLNAAFLGAPTDDPTLRQVQTMLQVTPRKP